MRRKEKIEIQGVVSNEEELKAKIILPYIDSLGFTLEDIELETGLNIRLGRKAYCIDTAGFKENARGRLDILCKKGNRNLFVIEVKGENIKITKDDIDQGISYARLVHPIAPFLLVTNGKETQVIDVITKDKLNGIDIGGQSEFWSSGCKLSVTEELEQRYEALKHFIGYSSDNLRAFSNSQIEGRMQTLKGNRNELNKKYIPEMFLLRKELVAKFNRFMDSSYQCLALIGEAGVGKTNYMCGLAEYFTNHCIVFFFNAASLARNIIDNIKEDFNWFFSPQLEPADIFRRLESLAENGKSKICFFFDAVDEAPVDNFNNDLDDFVRKLKYFPNVKICVSCKTSEWNRFLKQKGNPTYLSESIFPVNNEGEHISFKNVDQLDKSNIIESSPGCIIERFSEEEIEMLDKYYKNYFKYEGQLKGNIREECKLGFLLRVLAEAYQGESLPDIIEGDIL